MSIRLQIVGDIERRDHYYLDDGHACYFFGEYTPYEHTDGKRAAYSETNQHIGNLKKSMSRKGMHDWHYKAEAIEAAATRLHRALNWSVSDVRTAMFVPVPPSKLREDPLYDDRILQVLRKLDGKLPFNLDVRDMLISDGSLSASHTNQNRASPSNIQHSLTLDPTLSGKQPAPTAIFLLDDVLTTGAHFVGISAILRQKFPDAGIFGIFLARTVRPQMDASDFDIEI